MHEVDDVKRALVRADVLVLAERTQLPAKVIMSMVANNGWSVEQAARDIDAALCEVALSIRRESEDMLFGGSAGGGKQFTMAQVADFRARLRDLERPRGGVVLTCVS